jgi:hypothetical protein
MDFVNEMKDSINDGKKMSAILKEGRILLSLGKINVK